MNPLAQMMGGAAPTMGGLNPQAIQAIQSVKRMMNMLGAVKNPQAALMAAAQQNPALGSAMQMCQGRDPKTVFYEQCKQHGVDPETVLSQLR